MTKSTPTTQPGESQGARSPIFVTTHWSVVLSAASTDTTRARDALSNLCQAYWYPLYAYARRRGNSPQDAEDLTQGFFERLLEQNGLGDADREKGRFRTFLLSAMSHFMSDEWDKARAQKRGGGVPMLPLEFDCAETRYSREPATEVTPEQEFERRWAMTLLEQVLGRLQKQYEEEGKAALFSALSPCLVGERGSQPYASLGGSLGMSESAIKSVVHRLRQQYRQLLREEIAHTVAAPGEVEAELRHLITVLAG